MSERKRKGKDKNLPAKYKKSRKVLKIISIFFLCVFLVIFAGCIYIGVKVSDIVAEEIDNCADFVTKVSAGEISKLDLSTFMYDKDGNKIDVLYGNENRIELKYDEIPKSVVDAVVSIEDERFFEHKGVDLKRTFGAAYTYLTNNGNSDFGGSTITQQLVKNVTEDKETNIKRKIREWYRAYVLESNFSKEKIFEEYINTIYMGEGAYGFEVASKKYFGKSLKDVNLSESAVLAAAIQSPESTNPYTSDECRKRLLDRKNVVLSKMLELGKITTLEYNEAINTNIEFKKQEDGNTIKSYFVDAVIEQMIADLREKENISYEEAKKKVYTSGYRIYTTLDQSVQNAIDNAYNNGYLFYTEANGDFMQSAMVVMDHTNGNVVGLIGGASKKEENLSLNRATQSYRQPGSCMKPIGAYGPAFEMEKLNENSYIEDAPITIRDWSPQNYYHYFNGFVTVRRAIALSMNTPAVRANMLVDTSFAFDFAKNCGLKSLTAADKDIAPLALGGLTHGVTPLEMANAYATIANKGIYNSPKFYTKVLDSTGKEILFKASDSKRVMKESTATMLTTCLQDVITYGTGYGSIKVGNMPVVGKTGNSNDDKDQWFCGFTPYYTIACWNGYDIPRTIGYRKYGSYPYTAMKLFNSVMNDICKDKEIKGF